MSATLATTLRRRTSEGTVPRIGRFGVVSTPLVTKSEPWQHPCRCRPHLPVDGPLDLRRTLGRCRAGRATRRSGSRTGVPGGRPGPRDGPASLALVHAGDELRAEAWGPGAERALGGPAGPPRRSTSSRRRSRPVTRSSPTRPPRPGRPDPADRAPSSSRSSRRSSSRRSPARRRVARGSASSAPTASRRPARPNGASGCGPPPADPRRAPLLRLPPVRRRAAPGRPHPAGRGAGRLVRGDRRPAARRGLRPADGRARDRAVDRGRGRRPGAGRPGRGERRRLPPAEPRGVRAGRRAARRPTTGCSSCSSRTAASAPGSSACSS